jgi:hypothetical protein
VVQALDLVEHFLAPLFHRRPSRPSASYVG